MNQLWCAVEIERHLDSHQDRYICLYVDFNSFHFDINYRSAAFFSRAFVLSMYGIPLSFVFFSSEFTGNAIRLKLALECTAVHNNITKTFAISAKFHLIYSKCIFITTSRPFDSGPWNMINLQHQQTAKCSESSSRLSTFSTSEKCFQSQT